MIEDVLRSLLADRNVPVKTAQQLLDRMLDDWKQSETIRNGFRFAAEHCWRLTRDRGPIGPRVVGLRKTVRVTRIMPLDSFLAGQDSEVRHRLAILGFAHRRRQQSDRELRHFLRSVPGLNPPNHYDRYWVTLSGEIEDRSADEIRDIAGLLHHGPGTTLVGVSYDIAATELHVPTIVDAGISPGFVSKPSRNIDFARSWNWRDGAWGVSELIHGKYASFGPPVVDILGTIQTASSPTAFASFLPAVSEGIERAVSDVLRRTVAHRDLEPFARGEVGLLEISPREFEHFVGTLYARRGYHTKVTKSSHDGGIDVIAISDVKKKKGLLIQAKRTRKSVGIRVIRELIGARVLAGRTQSMLVVATTGRFSREARRAEEQRAIQLTLRDFDDLQRELRTIEQMGVTDIVNDALFAARR